MAQKIYTVKLRVPAGKVAPTPQISSVLGPRRVNLMKFCKECSLKTAEGFDPGEIVSVALDIFADNSFKIRVRGLSVADMIFKAAGIKKGAGSPGKQFIARLSIADVGKIAEAKLPFMNAYDVGGAVEMVKGTAISSGVMVVEDE